jgi:hypothetical protein
VKIKERLLALEDPIGLTSKSKILKMEDYPLFKLRFLIFNLELIYSSYIDGDKISAFTSKCHGIAPTLIVIKSENGKRFVVIGQRNGNQMDHTKKDMVSLYFYLVILQDISSLTIVTPNC